MLQYCLASCLIVLFTLTFVQILFLVLMEWFGWCEVWFLHLLWLASGTWMHLQTAWSPCPLHVRGRRVWACCSCYTWLITTSQISASLSWLDTQTYGSCIWQTTTCRLSLQGKSVRLLGKTMPLGGSCHLLTIVWVEVRARCSPCSLMTKAWHFYTQSEENVKGDWHRVLWAVGFPALAEVLSKGTKGCNWLHCMCVHCKGLSVVQIQARPGDCASY